MSIRAAWRLESLGFSEVRDYTGGKVDWMAFGYAIEGDQAAIPTVRATMRTDAPVCQLTDPVAPVRERMAAGGWTWCAVLNPAGILLGRLRVADIEQAPEGALAKDVMEDGPSTYRPDVPVTEILDRMKAGGFKLVFVTDPDGRWLGLASRQAIETVIEEQRSQTE